LHCNTMTYRGTLFRCSGAGPGDGGGGVYAGTADKNEFGGPDGEMSGGA